MPLVPLPAGQQGYEFVGTGGGARFARPRVFDVSRPPYSVDLTGTTDATTAMQNAIDDAAAVGTGGIVLIPYGRVKISSTLTWKLGTSIQGGFGSGDGGSGVKMRPPTILWYGDSTSAMIETATLTPPNNWTWGTIRRLALFNVTGQNRPKYGIRFTTRCDSGTYFEDIQLAGMGEYGTIFEAGGINVHLRDFRTDGIRYSAIKWVLGSNDSLSIRDFTVDNQRSDLSTAGGTLELDASSATDNEKFYFRAQTGKVETNYNMTATNGHFLFAINPAVSQRHIVHATFEDVWEAPGGGVTTHPGVKISPPFDYVSLRLENCKLAVEGVPTYTNSDVGTTYYHIHTIIAPHSSQAGMGVSSEKQATEVVGELNVIGPVARYSKRAASVLQMTSSDLTGVTLMTGDLICDPATVASGHRVVREVSVAGTLGTLSGVTGTGSSGTSTLTVNDTTNLACGQYISIGADTGKRISHINATTKVVTLGAGLGVSHSSEAVSFTAPTFREGQFIPLTGSKTWDPGSVAVGGSATTTVTVSGAALGDFAVPSFSLDLQGLVLTAYVSAADTVTCVLSNPTAGAVDLGSGTLKVKVSSR